MSVSLESVGSASLRVKYPPWFVELILGATVVLRFTVFSVPPAGVFFTVKALFARFSAGASKSENKMTSSSRRDIAYCFTDVSTPSYVKLTSSLPYESFSLLFVPVSGLV